MAVEKKPEARGGVVGAIGQFAVVIAIVLLTKTVAAEAYYVPSGSMLPSLLIGDQLLVSKFPYGYSRYSLPVPLAPASNERVLGKLPARGDVVVFRLPRDPSQTYVKRVVGLPGDRVQMRDGRLWLNGKMVPLRRDGIGEMETETGVEAAPRYVETLRRARASDLQVSLGRRTRRHAGIHGRRGPDFRDGRQPRRFRRQPDRAGRGRRRLRAGRESGRPRRCDHRLVGPGGAARSALDLAVGLAVLALFLAGELTRSPLMPGRSPRP